MGFGFESLIVYQKSQELSTELVEKAISFEYKYSWIRDQLIGAVISVPLNIAESSGRRNSKEKLQFLRIAQASSYELVAILEICNSLNLVKKEEYVALKDKIEQICKILSSLMKPK